MPDDSWFDADGRLVLRSYSLRYLLTVILAREAGPMEVAELVEQLQRRNMTVSGRPSKAISDVLRSEISRGRVVRVGWGRYQFGSVPESTMRRLRARARYLEGRAGVPSAPVSVM